MKKIIFLLIMVLIFSLFSVFADPTNTYKYLKTSDDDYIVTSDGDYIYLKNGKVAVHYLLD